jgi:triosephosphate isomerase (TIM)
MQYLIANWKMQLNESESETTAREIVRLWSAQADRSRNVTVVLCPGAESLDETAAVLQGTNVALGAQDAFWEEKGAYTGEISPTSLKEAGCEYCIVGHSERRQYLGETDAMVQKKVAALLKRGIVPVVCVGEVREEREAGKHASVVIAQVRAALEGNAPVGTQRILIAYEPRWAIGTGKACSAEDAAEMTHLIRETLNELYSADVVRNQFAVLYGGSADAENIGAYADVHAIDGALVGGSSLKPAVFVRMAETLADRG